MKKREANQGRDIVGRVKSYTENDVKKWRSIKRENKLSDEKLGLLIGKSKSTIRQAFQEY
jgi:hypothetical protein